MLPLISFETGRKTQTQSSGQPDQLHQQMEVWFYPRIETAAERPTRRADEAKDLYTCAPPERVRRDFLPLDKDLS
jgi:hypothetical protein